MLAIKQQEQASYQALMSNPLRLKEMQERNGIKPKKDKKEPKPQASNTKPTKVNSKTLSVASPKVEETSPNDIDADASESSDSEESEEDELQPNAPSPTVDEKITEKAKSKPKKKETRRGILRPPRTLETTMFDRLEKMYGPSIKRMLTVQYR